MSRILLTKKFCDHISRSTNANLILNTRFNKQVLGLDTFRLLIQYAEVVEAIILALRSFNLPGKSEQ